MRESQIPDKMFCRGFVLSNRAFSGFAVNEKGFKPFNSNEAVECPKPFSFGSGRRIRTLTNRVRVCRATFTQARLIDEHNYIEFSSIVKRKRSTAPFPHTQIPAAQLARLAVSARIGMASPSLPRPGPDGRARCRHPALADYTPGPLVPFAQPDRRG